jgi:hypothetical protein
MTPVDYIIRAQRCRQKASKSKNPKDVRAWKELAEIYQNLATGVSIFSRLPSKPPAKHLSQAHE